MRSVRSTIVAAAVAGVLAACGAPADTAPAQLATPEVTLDRAEAAVSSPVEVTYRFRLLPGNTLTKDYTVFVHFTDADGQLMWTDDHAPAVPTTKWTADAAVSYTRTMFIPKFPYEGPTSVDVGLWDPSTGERVKMEGESSDRAYRAASFTMKLQSDAPFLVFTEGWHQVEGAGSGGEAVEWHWSKAEGTLACKNPKRDLVLYLELDQPVSGAGATKAEVRIGDTVLDTIDLSSQQRSLRKISISAAQLGDGDAATIKIVPDVTVVPATVPDLKNSDTRELGVRVFRASLQPK